MRRIKGLESWEQEFIATLCICPFTAATTVTPVGSGGLWHPCVMLFVLVFVRPLGSLIDCWGDCCSFLVAGRAALPQCWPFIGPVPILVPCSVHPGGTSSSISVGTGLVQ